MAIVFDLEATCDDKGNWDNETIQIGAVNTETGETFNQFIFPIKNPILTPFCTRLTGITQEQVDNKGTLFTFALVDFLEWGGQYNMYLSWGYYDKKQLMKDCERHQMRMPLITHRSLKHDYAEITKTSPRGMKEVLRREGLTLDGRHHDGLADALNIAKIYKAKEEQFKRLFGTVT